MKSRRSIFTLVLWILVSLAAIAQDVIVTVTPVQQVLPPQVLMYIDNPGKFFGVQLTNNTDREQQIYIGMQIEQKNPSVGLALSTPPKRQPQRPIVLAAHSTVNLTSLEIKNLFKHIPSNEISAPAGLFDDYQNGSFALLPEGEYEAHLTAYRWSNPQLNNPLVVSNPSGGMAHFTVCYKAQAPQFIVPNPRLTGANLPEIDPIAPLFYWTEPTLTCNPAAQSYRYDFRVVEVLPGQQYDDAMDHNPVVYINKNLVSPQIFIPELYMRRDFKPGVTYLAQVTARPVTTTALDYVMLENEGKSTYTAFKIKSLNDTFGNPTIDGGDKKGDKKDDADDSDKQDEKKADDEGQKDKGGSDGSGIENVDVGIDIPGITIDPFISIGDEIDLDDIFIAFGEAKGDAVITEQAPYRFRNPKIDKPIFVNDNVHRYYEKNDLPLEWTRAWYLGGEGRNPEQIKFEYNVQLYNGGDVISSTQAFLNPPIFEKKTSEEELTIKWDDIKNKVNVGDELYVRIVPIPDSHEEEIEWEGEDNVLGLTLCRPVVNDLFKCSTDIEITNLHPTSLTAAQLRGSVVKIGEFTMELGDDIQNDSRKAGTFTGHAKVQWEPGGFRTNVHVKLDTVSINTDMQVIGGRARTYAKTGSKVDGKTDGVDKLFSDDGMENLVGASGNYAYQYQNSTSLDKDDPENAINVNVDVQGYFEYFHNLSGSEKANANKLGKSSISDFYCPARLPDDVNLGPLDMQIASMTFTSTYAVMDVVGELQIGEGVNKNNILMFGAPRLCISPRGLIPEAGTLALLADYGNIRDPKTGYTCRFKAPKNLQEPTNGCYMAWKDYKFGELGIDVDMKIPNLNKVENGKATQKKPILNIKTTINSWDEWVANATMDPFEVDALPGWQFEASTLIVDHSTTKNGDNMASFPEGYDKSKAGLSGQNPEFWEGLYIKDIAIKLPASMKIGSGRMKLDMHDMFIDKSGLTMKGGVNNVYAGKTASMGGWSFSLDEIGISFIQSDFNNCYFKGDLGLPLLTTDDGKKAKLAYDCEIRRRISGAKLSDGTAFLFTVRPADNQNLNIDLFLAKVQLSKATTYFAAELTSGPTDADSHANVEFCMGGVIELGAKDQIEKFGKSKLNIDFNIPDVHFTGLRIANCDDEKWTSAYASIKKLQDARRAVKLNEAASYVYYGGKTVSSSDGSFWFSTGQWSLASLEKQLGPLKFKLEKYGLDLNLKSNPKDGNYAEFKLNLKGSVSFIDGFSITAATSVNLIGRATIHSLSDIEGSFQGINVDSCAVDCSVAGMSFFGDLKIGDSPEFGKGFSGGLEIKLPGDLFTLQTMGGFYKRSEGWNWGYMTVEMEAKAGVPVPPIEFNGFSGGFYFNCSSAASNPKKVTPKKGVIGLMLGVNMQAVGSPDLFHGDLKLTVVYDTSRGCFSQFLFTGNLHAVDDLVSSKVTVLYENNDMDKFFQLNITVDAMAAASLETMQDLNEEAQGYATAADMTHDVKNLQSEEEEYTKKDKKVEGNPETTADTKSALDHHNSHFELDFKITFKENGKTLPRKKWHLYLGEPELSKRISLVLINLDAGIVDLNVGANMYVCIGNELPGDGSLPEIPNEIARFLNGSKAGKYVQSDNISGANAARSAAAGNFGAGISGGVMFGAEVYGHLGLHLGLLEGGFDMLAGFDVSLRKLSGAAECMNLGRTPGWHGWYGEGQLYAYLRAYINLCVDLGFFDPISFNLINAEMGGLLQMGGPAPSYFIGKLRAKVKLLGGLVNFDKKFEFECGQVCRLYRGDPLDDFVLFDKSTVGDTLKNAGWDVKNRIAPIITQSPRIMANASLNEHFRLLDENELQTILDDYNATGAEREDLEMQAERTFIFRHRSSNGTNDTRNATVKLIRYEGGDKRAEARRLTSESWDIPVLNERGSFLALDLNVLNSHIKPNSFYALKVTGYAKELYQGNEINPRHYQKGGKYVNTPWEQTAYYYFATNGNEDVEDHAELQKYVALAYPSKLNQLMDGVKDSDVENYRPTYYNDATAPTIALNRDIHELAFRKGRVQWRVSTPDNIQIYATDAAWVTRGGNICSLEPKNVLQGVEEHGKYIISIDYLVPNKETELIDTIALSRQHVKVLPKSHNWQTGTIISGKRQNLDYEKPFVVTNLWNYPEEKEAPRLSDYDIAMGKMMDGKYIFNLSPSYYTSYLMHWAFLAGRNVESSFFKGLYVTTTQSAILSVPGAGSYEGVYSSNSYRIMDKLGDIKRLLFYNGDPKLYGLYALPTLSDPAYDYVGITDPAIMPHYPDNTLLDRATNVLGRIRNYYKQVQDVQDELTLKSKELIQALGPQYIQHSVSDNQLGFLKRYIGVYFGNDLLKVPYYQVMIGCAPHEQAGQYDIARIFGDVGQRGYRFSQLAVMLNLIKDGSKIDDYKSVFPAVATGTLYPQHFDGNASYNAESALKGITSLIVQSYRVNAFDLLKGQYTCSSSLLNGPFETMTRIDNPFNNPKATDVSQAYLSTHVNNSSTVSSGTRVGGEDFNMAGSTEMNSLLESMKGYVRTILAHRNSISPLREKCEEMYKSVKSSYDSDMKGMVTLYNKQEFATFASSTDLYNLKINQLRGHVETEKEAYVMYHYKQAATAFSLLQTCYNAVAQSVAKNSAALADAEAELNRGAELNGAIIEDYKQITEWYNDAVSLKNDYVKAACMMNQSSYDKASQIRSKSGSILSTMKSYLDSGKKLDTAIDDFEDNYKLVKEYYEEEIASYGDATFQKEYDRKIPIETKLKSAASKAITAANSAQSFIDYLAKHQNDINDFMVDINTCAPRGTNFYTAQESNVKSADKLFAERGAVMASFTYTHYDVDDYIDRSNAYMAKLKEQVDIEPLYLTLKELRTAVENLRSKADANKTTRADIWDIYYTQDKMDSLLRRCILYVLGYPYTYADYRTVTLNDGVHFKNLTSASTDYKAYQKYTQPIREKYTYLKAGVDSIQAITNRAQILADSAKTVHDVYVNRQTLKKYLTAADNTYTSIKGEISNMQSSLQESKENLAEINKNNTKLVYIDLYPTPESINKAARDLVTYRKKFDSMLEEVEVLKDQVKLDSKDYETARAPFQKFVDDIGREVQNKMPYLLSWNLGDQHTELLLNENGELSIYDILTYEYNGYKLNTVFKGNIVQMVYEYFPLAAEDVADRVNSASNSHDAFIRLDSVYEAAQRIIATCNKNVPMDIPDARFSSDEFLKISETRFSTNLMDKASFLNEYVDLLYPVYVISTAKAEIKRLSQGIDLAQSYQDALDYMQVAKPGYDYGMSLKSDVGAPFEIEKATRWAQLYDVFCKTVENTSEATRKYIASGAATKAKQLESVRKLYDMLAPYCQDLLQDQLVDITKAKEIVDAYDMYAGLASCKTELDKEVERLSAYCKEESKALDNISTQVVIIEWPKARNLYVDENTRDNVLSLSKAVNDNLVALFDSWVLDSKITATLTNAFYNSIEPYQGSRDKITANVEALKALCEKLPGYRQQLSECYEAYAEKQIFEGRREEAKQNMEDALRKMDEIEQMTSESMERLAACKEAMEEADRLAKLYPKSSSLINSAAFAMQNLIKNLPQAITDIQTASRQVASPDDSPRTWLGSTDAIAKAFDNAMDDVEGGHMSIVDKFTFIENEGEQGYEEERSVNVMDLLHDYLVPELYNARAQVKTGSLDVFASAQTNYTKLKTTYDTYKTKVPSGLRAWAKIEEYKSQLDSAYLDFARKADQKTYYTQAIASHEIRFINYVKGKANKLKLQMVGYESVYTYALDVEQKLQAFETELKKQQAIVDEILSSGKPADGSLRGPIDDVYLDYQNKLKNLHTKLLSKEQIYEQARKELKQFYDDLYDYDYEVYVEEVADDLIQQMDKVNKVYYMGVNLKKAMDVFEKDIKRIEWAQ